MGITTVYLQAFADPAGDGLVKAVYFPNRWLPVKADIFSRIAWQLRTRANAAVYALDAGPELGYVGKLNPRA